jgi:hypothetical protein
MAKANLVVTPVTIAARMTVRNRNHPGTLICAML